MRARPHRPAAVRSEGLNEGEGVVGEVEGDDGVFGEGASDEGAGEFGFDLALEETLEGAGAEDGVVAALGGPSAGGGGEGDRDAAVGEAAV